LTKTEQMDVSEQQNEENKVIISYLVFLRKTWKIPFSVDIRPICKVVEISLGWLHIDKFSNESI